ncbi:unnamed protein product [Cylicostephanus goldi]|uniref:Uncharacterized protein n=1 Tax=Cylicostephanus goldi TaxID=71465 RepID=A0A3P7P4T1_CYLGO|nr:unnamed protein product [Cylicostephanus goldi]
MYESDDTFGSNAISALKSLYKKCMDEDELNRIGARRMIENVKVGRVASFAKRFHMECSRVSVFGRFYKETITGKRKITILPRC